MDLTEKLALSYYKTISTLNESHQVYLVQHQQSGKICVKKTLDVYNRDIYEYLYHNPVVGIPKIIEYYEDDNQLILIEEYISGASLQEMIGAHQLSLEDIQNYITDICDILEALHALNPPIVHRDIKPSNIIITDYNRAMLLDFNAAKFYSAETSEDTMLLGTHGYAAPEQYGFGPSSPQTDIYAIGVLLREMVASNALTTSASQELLTIAERCTKLSPSERFQSVSELKDALSKTRKNAHSSASSSSTHRWAPPGFRTRTPWKMLISSIVYLFIFYLCITLNVENTYGVALWMERIFLLFTFLLLIFAPFDYLNMQRMMPLCKSGHRVVRILGIILLELIIFVLMMLILFIFEIPFLT